MTDRKLNLGVLDALRGLAALYVLLHHAYQILWVGYEPYIESAPSGVGHFLAYAGMQAFRYGTQAVLLFFLISGFCIHYRQSKALASDRPGRSALSFDVFGFAWRRARRLYPPLIVALMLTIAFDYAGGVLAPPLYDGSWVAQGHSLVTLTGNLLFQANLAVPVFGSNAPLWSLGFEFWFYVLYPLALLLSRRGGGWLGFGVVALISGTALATLQFGGVDAPGLGTLNFPGFWGWRVLAYWVVWTAGMFLADVYTGRVRTIRFRWLAPFGVVLPLLMVLKVAKFGPDYKDDVVWSLGFALALGYVMTDLPRAAGRGVERVSQLLHILGAMSYSLYVVHYPLLLLVSAWWLTSHRSLPLGPELALLGIILALSVSWLCWYCVERHFVSSASRRMTAAPPPAPAVAGLNAPGMLAQPGLNRPSAS